MNIAIWVLTGSALGWVGYAYLNLNQDRGLMVSLIAGAVGGFIGGNVIAPMLTAGALAPGDFSTTALFSAAAVAAAILAGGNLIHKRWGV